MSTPPHPEWHASDALEPLPVRPLAAHAYRMHSPRYPADIPSGHAGRYNPSGLRALYLGMTKEVCYAEMLRWLPSTAGMSAEDMLERIRTTTSRRRTRLRVELSRVLDLRDPSVIGLRLDDLCQDDFEGNGPTHAIGRAAFEREVEGLLVPSASRDGTNLVVFTDNLLPGSHIEIIDWEDPKTFVSGR